MAKIKNMRIVDDYNDSGFGGYYAIEVSDDDEFYGDEYLGERDCPESQAVAATGAEKMGNVFIWTSMKETKKAFKIAKTANLGKEK